MQQRQNEIQKAVEDSNSASMMFAEMKTLLSRNLDQPGRVSAVRGLKDFTSRLESYDPRNYANSSDLMKAISSDTAALLSTVQTASRGEISSRAEAARRTTDSLKMWSSTLGAEAHMLGVYRHAAISKKDGQRALVNNPIASLKEDIAKVSTDELLMAFDRSWWSIRTKLDAYLDAADNQAVAFGNAVKALDDYTSKCTASFEQLNLAQLSAIKADDAASKQLRETWYAVVEELGLLAARISDTHAFVDLGRLDARLVNLDAHQAQICKEPNDNSTKQMVSEAVGTAMEQGLTHQTWVQFEAIFSEMPMLEGRFFAHGLEVPGDRAWQDSAKRAFDSFKELISNVDEISSEVVTRMCASESHPHSTQAAFIETRQDVDKLAEEAVREQVAPLNTQNHILMVMMVGVMIMIGYGHFSKRKQPEASAEQF
jgi:hypothetical protein